LTAWLRDIGKDPHLRVRHVPEGAPSAEQAKAAFATWFREKARRENGGVARIEQLDGNVAVLELTNFFDAATAGEELIAAMQLIAGPAGRSACHPTRPGGGSRSRPENRSVFWRSWLRGSSRACAASTARSAHDSLGDLACR
jgi:hypothetical protein